MPRSAPDIRRIRRTRSYTALELAFVLRIAAGTVRRWVREGMPLIDDERPKLVNGAQFLAWHEARRKARKIKCGPRQMYCCKCRDARIIMPGSAVIIHRNEKSSTVRALCIQCGTVMNRHCARRNAVEWIDFPQPSKGQELRLMAFPNSLVNANLAAPGAEAGKLQ